MNSVLLPIIMALVAGHAPAALAMLGTVTVQQWATIAGTAIQDAPDVIKALNALPVPTTNSDLLTDLERAAITGVVSANLRRWIVANEQTAVAIQDQSIRNQR